MAGVLSWLLANALEASVLAAGVGGLLKLKKVNAATRHALWLLVIVKLLMPPVTVHSVGLSRVCRSLTAAIEDCFRPREATDASEPIAPRSEPAATAPRAPEPASVPPLADIAAPSRERTATTQESLALERDREPAGACAESTSASAPVTLEAADRSPRKGAASLQDERAQPSPDARPARVGAGAFTSVQAALGAWRRWLLAALIGVWAAGCISMLVRHARETIGVSRLLAVGEAAPRALHDRCAAVASRMGLRRAPTVWITDAAVSPMVWSLGPPRIVLSRAVVRDSGALDLTALLAHEVAHVRRLDHWICWLEIPGSCLFWWLPTFWFARDALRAAADEAADSWAVGVVGDASAYAASLVATVELLFWNARPAPTPALGQGLGEREVISRRLAMILREPSAHRWSWSSRLAVAVVALLVLPAASGRPFAQSPPAGDPGARSSATAKPTTVAPPREKRSGARASSGSTTPGLEDPVPAGRTEPARVRSSEERLDALEQNVEKIVEQLGALRASLSSEKRATTDADRYRDAEVQYRAAVGSYGQGHGRADAQTAGTKPIYETRPGNGWSYPRAEAWSDANRYAFGGGATRRYDPTRDYKVLRDVLSAEQREQMKKLNKDFSDAVAEIERQLETLKESHDAAVKAMLNPRQLKILGERRDADATRPSLEPAAPGTGSADEPGDPAEEKPVEALKQ